MSPASQIRDTRPVSCRFFDRDDRLVGSALMPPRADGEAPRRIDYDGKAYIEGDGSGFYGENKFAEIVPAGEVK